MVPGRLESGLWKEDLGNALLPGLAGGEQRTLVMPTPENALLFGMLLCLPGDFVCCPSLRDFSALLQLVLPAPG